MTQYDTMQAVAAKLQQRRDMAEETLQKHHAECEAANPRFLEIRKLLISISIQIARVAMVANSSDTVKQLLDQSQDLQNERVQLLRKMGKQQNYLTKTYTCETCEDTGKLMAGRCTCADKLFAEISAKSLNAASICCSSLSCCDAAELFELAS